MAGPQRVIETTAADVQRILAQTGAKPQAVQPSGAKLYVTRQGHFLSVTPLPNGTYRVVLAQKACDC